MPLNWVCMVFPGDSCKFYMNVEVTWVYLSASNQEIPDNWFFPLVMTSVSWWIVCLPCFSIIKLINVLLLNSSILWGGTLRLYEHSVPQTFFTHQIQHPLMILFWISYHSEDCQGVLVCLWLKTQKFILFQRAIF